MSLTITIPTPRRRHPAGWNETDAVALAVAGLTAIHVRPDAVRTVVAESLARHGGPEGVRAELDRQLADTPRRAAHTARTLDWARRTLAAVDPA